MNQNSSTKKGVNRARKANGQNNKSRSSPAKAVVNRNVRRQQSNQGSLPQRSVASAYASGQIGKAPKIAQTRDNCRIMHRELISSVVGSTDFTVQNSFPLNPGMSKTFPWLSSMARSWEQYKFHKLKFCYFTRTGSTTVGSMMMAPDYDAADTAPQSEQIASSYEDVTEDAPWKDIVCNLPPSRLNSNLQRKFLRSGPLGPNLDIKSYDSGNLFVITIDGQNVNWGKLWVEYDVEFFIPQLPPTGIVNVQGGEVVMGTSISAESIFGALPTMTPSSLGIIPSAFGTLTFESPGSYVVYISLVGTTMPANLTLLNALPISETLNSTATYFDGVYAVNVLSGADSTVSFVSGGSVTSTLCVIGSIPSGSLL